MNLIIIMLLYIAALLLSRWLNKIVDLMEEEGTIDGYRAWLVLVGAGYTLALAALIVDPLALLKLIGLICCALAPMIHGDMRRHRSALSDKIQFWRNLEEVKRGKTTDR